MMIDKSFQVMKDVSLKNMGVKLPSPLEIRF